MNRPPLKFRRRPKTAVDFAFEDEAVDRYHDPSFNAIAVKVHPGEHYVTRSAEEMIATVLGSCVCACIRDSKAGVGEMNHFMLPESAKGEWGQQVPASLRYGNFAMERLINDILKLSGRRSNLEMKVFGGANVLRNGATIGHQNSEFIESYLKAEGLPIAAQRLYGKLPRRVHYFPTTGKVLMLELRRQDELERIRIEQSYRDSLKHNPISGSIEFFL
jgi:chemotaxis protein CheD